MYLVNSCNGTVSMSHWVVVNVCCHAFDVLIVLLPSVLLLFKNIGVSDSIKKIKCVNGNPIIIEYTKLLNCRAVFNVQSANR